VAKRRVACVVEVWSGSGVDEVRQVRGDGAQQVSKSVSHVDEVAYGT
jgi:hypothetical protein